jgi:hypothetical protein
MLLFIHLHNFPDIHHTRPFVYQERQVPYRIKGILPTISDFLCPEVWHVFRCNYIFKVRTTEYSTNRVAMVTFWSIFHHDGKISPEGGGCTPNIFHCGISTTTTITYKVVVCAPAERADTYGGFIKGILRGVRCTKSLRVLFLHRRPPSWTTLVLYSRAVFIFNEPAYTLPIFLLYPYMYSVVRTQSQE